MNSTFGRALIGFLVLTAGLSGMVTFALWAINVFGGAAWWAGLLVAIVALAAEISVYASTLHDPIRGWIMEPAKLKRKAELEGYEKRYVDDAVARALRQHETEMHEAPTVPQRNSG